MFCRRWLISDFITKNVRRTSKRTFTNRISNACIVESCIPEVNIPKITLPEFLNPYLDKFEQHTAIECAITKRKYTYGEIRKKSSNLAKALRKIFKLQDGDAVAVILTNIPEYPIVNLGILKANLIISAVSPVFKSDEICRQLLDSGAKAVITEIDLTPTVKKSLEMLHQKLPLLTIKTINVQNLPEGVIDFHQLVNTNFDFPDIIPCNQDDVACLPYSSGTTGLPKGVQLTHRNLVANLLQNNHPDFTFKNEATETFQEVLPTILPFYHIFGYTVVMNETALYGGKIITMSKFNPDLYISTLAENQNSTVLYLVPPIVLMLITQDQAKKEHLKNMNAILNGAAPLGASDEHRFRDKFGDHIKILQGYGLTETSPVLTSLFPKYMESIKEDVYRGSVGKPLPGTSFKVIDINDSTYSPLPPKTTGELLVKGPQVMNGYFKRPDETKKTFTEDGWFRTGDVGHYNEEGFIFITDRFKELIKVKGSQVAPAELEALIRSFPGVIDTAVIGIPHEVDGETPRAYVVVGDKQKFDTQKLDDFVTEKVAKYKRLKGGIVLIDEIPKNPSGKILRRSIKENFLKKGI